MITSRILELKEKIEQETQFEEKCILNFELIKCYNTFDLDESIKIIKLLLKKNELKQNEDLFIKAQIHYAIILIKRGNYKLSIKILSTLTQKEPSFVLDKVYTSVYSSLATIYAELKEFNTAIYIWDKLYKACSAEENIIQRSIFANNIFSFSLATLNCKPNNIQEMLEFENILSQNNNYAHILCMTLANISNYYLYEGNKEHFKIYHKKAEELAKKWEAKDLLYHLYLLKAKYFHELTNDPENEKESLLKAIELSKNLKKENLDPTLFYRLYSIYYNENKYKQALMYHIKFHEADMEKNNMINLVDQKLKEIGFNIEMDKKNIFSRTAQNSIISNNQHFVILKNIKNENVKIDLQNIVVVTLVHTYVKIKLADNIKKEVVFKHSIHELYEKILEVSPDDKLFFFTNLRNEFVNLFWMSSFNNYDRKLILDVIGSKIEFVLSYRQSRILNKLFKK